jgi:hypothetical protein
MALSVSITRLLPLFPRGVFLQWDLLNPTETGSYCFNVYRSGSPEGPWEPLQMGGVDTYNYQDVLPVVSTQAATDVNQLSLTRGIFYRVEVVPPSGTDNKVEVVSVVEPRLDGMQRLLKRKILRDESLMLRKLNGVDVAVVKRMHWGPRCTVCWDKTTKAVTRANCLSCFGTGFSPGYFAPVLTLGRRGTIPAAKQIAPQGVAEFRPTQVTLLDAPKIEPDDVLVFLQDNKRFVVKAVLQTELKTVGVHQKLEVSELARSSVEYRLVVDPARIPPLF